jgi:cohesin complex subunit SA-1/2
MCELARCSQRTRLTCRVCVHRVRDSDAAIRTDCFRELGVWIRTYPSLFGDDVYLGYLAKGCNDQVS